MSRRPRIGVNALILGERPTGLGVYTLHLVRELARLRDDLVVFTSAPGALPSSVRAHAATAVVRPERGRLGHAARVGWLQAVLPSRLRREHVGVLVNTVPEGLLAPRVPQVTVVHDLLPLRYPSEYRRYRYYYRGFVPRVLRASRRVIADSECTRDDLLAAYGLSPDRVRVVRPGYDASVFYPGPDADAPAAGAGGPYVLYVGNFMPHKNLPALLDAFARVAGRWPCRLVLRGQGRPDALRDLRARVAALPSWARVEIEAYRPAGGLGDLYRGAALLVLPSLYEGFGLTALEAMACGTPVVAADTSSIPEVVGDAALLVDPTDAGALAEAMYTALACPAVRADLRRRGLERARQFSWSRTAAAVLALAEEAAA